MSNKRIPPNEATEIASTDAASADPAHDEGYCPEDVPVVSVRPIAKFLTSLAERVAAVEIQPNALMSKGRLSRKRVRDLAAAQGLEFSFNTLLGDPALYPIWRKLKLSVEGVVLGTDEVQRQWGQLIAELRSYLSSRPGVTTPSMLWLSDAQGRDLYLQVTCLPYAPRIWKIVELDEGRSNYDYWEDTELVDKASAFDTFTALKHADDALHRAIKGRGLERHLVQRNPQMCNVFYIAISGDVCRSVPELVLNNYLTLCEMTFTWQPPLGIRRRDSTRTMIADVYFPETGLFFECAQNLTADRGSRRENYAQRMKDKLDRCAESGIRVGVVDSDKFTTQGVLDVSKFAMAIAQELRCRGVEIAVPPAAGELLRSQHAPLRDLLIQGDLDAVFGCLGGLGIDGVAVLANRFSHILSCLKVRDDFKKILARLKARSNMRRWGHPG